MFVRFDKENMERGLPGLILLSHGPMATGIAETACMLISEQPNFAAFGLETSDTLEDYMKAVREAYELFEENAVFMVDLLGGTPCNQLSMWMLQEKAELHAISGLSLPMVIEAGTIREEFSGKELLKQLQERSQKSIVDIAERLHATSA